MSIRLRSIVFGLTLLISTLYVRDAQALWPLSYSYYCLASSATQVDCGFTVTNPGPSGYHYKWIFGDGAQTAHDHVCIVFLREVDEELVERALKLEELPAPVAATMKKELGNNRPTEIEAIIYEGIAVLYEAEYRRDGKEIEVVLRPWGELVPATAQEEQERET